MHTLTALLTGFLILWFMINLGLVLGLPREATDRAFVVLWLLASLHHGYRGVDAGYGLTVEVAIGSIIFVIPIALMAYLKRASARRTDGNGPK